MNRVDAFSISLTIVCAFALNAKAQEMNDSERILYFMFFKFIGKGNEINRVNQQYFDFFFTVFV